MDNKPQNTNALDRKVLLSTLWVVVVLNMIFADIYSAFVLLATKGAPEIPGDARTTMAVAVLLTNIPILIVLLSRILPYRANRLVNIIAGVLTAVYIVGGGTTEPHYIIAAAIEIILIAVIIWNAWTWQQMALRSQ